MQDLSSLTRDQTCAHCSGSTNLNHWTTRNIPEVTSLDVSSERPFLHLLLIPPYFTIADFHYAEWQMPACFVSLDPMMTRTCIHVIHQLLPPSRHCLGFREQVVKVQMAVPGAGRTW